MIKRVCPDLSRTVLVVLSVLLLGPTKLNSEPSTSRFGGVVEGNCVVTIAGKSSGDVLMGGFEGDGGAAKEAKFTTPAGLAVDASDNLLIADYGNGRIRRITTDGNISTIGQAAEGEGTKSVAVAADGTLFYTTGPQGRLFQISPDLTQTVLGGDGSDWFTTLEGNEFSRVDLPDLPGIAIDGEEALYVTTWSQEFGREMNAIQKIYKNRDGVYLFETFAGDEESDYYRGNGRPAIPLDLKPDNFSGLAISPAGELFVADTGNHRIVRITMGGQVSIYAGNGTAGFSGDGALAAVAQLGRPSGIVFDKAGNLYIADTGNSRIRKVSPDGIIGTLAGASGEMREVDGRMVQTGGGTNDGSVTEANFAVPTGLAIDSKGNLHVSEWHRIRRIFRSENCAAEIAFLNGTAGGPEVTSLPPPPAPVNEPKPTTGTSPKPDKPLKASDKKGGCTRLFPIH